MDCLVAILKIWDISRLPLKDQQVKFGFGEKEVQALVNKIKIEIEKNKGTGKTEMNENVADYSELIAQILAGTFGAAVTVGFGNLVLKMSIIIHKNSRKIINCSIYFIEN